MNVIDIGKSSVFVYKQQRNDYECLSKLCRKSVIQFHDSISVYVVHLNLVHVRNIEIQE